jgi:hypothetical protein
MKIYSANISGSLSVTGSVNIVTAPNVPIQGTIATASFISPTFISASAAASGFGSGGGTTTDISALNTFSGSMLTFTASIQSQVNNLRAATSSYVVNSSTASFVTNAQTASMSVLSASAALTASFINTLTQNVTINGNLQVFGTASYSFVSASQLNVGTNTISVNVAEPAQRFGGLIVYDSGSLSHQATSSLLWDSLNNKWIYQQVSGSTYDGGMLISGPRNSSGIGNEVGTTNNALMKGQGGDHITSSRIFDDGTNVYTNSNVQITGSLTVTGNVVATASWASNSVTASYINPTFISASAAASGFGSGGGGGGVTSITAGDGISVNQSTGNVTITNTGGGSGGTNLGLVYAVSLGYLMP